MAPKRKLYIVTLSNGEFHSAYYSWEVLDTEKMARMLTLLGFEVNRITIEDVLSLGDKSESTLIYTSSPNEEVRRYIQDVMYLAGEFFSLVPSYKALLAHENKGFQELMRHRLGLDANLYHFDPAQLPKDRPYVFKTVDGSGSRGVNLIKSKIDLFFLKSRYFRFSCMRILKLAHRALVLSKNEYNIYRGYYGSYRRYVAQNFMDGLAFDYKILIFGDRYFVLKRYVRRGSFKASGSGNFEFNAVPNDTILDFARDIFQSLNEPFVSLDIAQNRDKIFLIEYQVFNFGPSTVTGSKFFFKKEGNTWVSYHDSSELVDHFAYALYYFLSDAVGSVR